MAQTKPERDAQYWRRNKHRLAPLRYANFLKWKAANPERAKRSQYVSDRKRRRKAKDVPPPAR